MKSVIMAGGKGSRLKPLTCNRPKPMVPIANRPMMEHIVELLQKHQFNEIWATLFYKGEMIEQHFGDGSKFGVKLAYCYETKPLGTAGSVKQAAQELDETFLVISGDALTDIDLTAALKFHKQHQAMATLILTRVENPLEYGVVITDKNNRVQRFLEKPDWGQVFSDTVNTGIYILEPEVLNFFEKDKPFDFSKDLFPLLLKEGEAVYGYIADGYWSDIGNLEQYHQAHRDILDEKIKINISGEERLPNLWIGKNVKIAETAKIIPPIIIGDYCRIGDGAEVGEYSVLSDWVDIAPQTEIKRSIIGTSVRIGERSELHGAIVDRRVHLKGHNHVAEGAVLGEASELGRKATVKNQVKIWSAKKVDSGTKVNENLIWASRSCRSLFGNFGISGTVNREITPEHAAKYGAIFGSQFNPKTKVVIGGENEKACIALKQAAIAGLQASGVDVCDLGNTSEGILRKSIIMLAAIGGMYFKSNEIYSEELTISFFDEKGEKLNKGIERSLENSYSCEDFRRVSTAEFGEVEQIGFLAKQYSEHVLSSKAAKAVKYEGVKIVTMHHQGIAEKLLPQLLRELGCEVLLNEKLSEGDSYLEEFELLKKVQESHADLGIFINNCGNKLLVVNNQGDVWHSEEIAVLLGKDEYVNNGESVLRDAFSEVLELLNLLIEQPQVFVEAKAKLPLQRRYYREIDCPWEAKGRIMRHLLEANEENRDESVNGLKIRTEEGWTMVLPDREEPIFRIYSEGRTAEAARDLAQQHTSKLLNLLSEDKN